jgi:hypothetical protein
LEDQGIGGEMGWITMDLKEIDLGGGWIGFDWLRTGTGVGLL